MTDLFEYSSSASSWRGGGSSSSRVTTLASRMVEYKESAISFTEGLPKDYATQDFEC